MRREEGERREARMRKRATISTDPSLLKKTN
jgi:hypothetical protein